MRPHVYPSTMRHSQRPQPPIPPPICLSPPTNYNFRPQLLQIETSLNGFQRERRTVSGSGIGMVGSRTHTTQANANGYLTNLTSTKNQNQQPNQISDLPLQMRGQNQQNNVIAMRLDQARPSVPCPTTSLVLPNRNSITQNYANNSQSSTYKQRRSNQSNFSKGNGQQNAEQSKSQQKYGNSRNELSNKLRPNIAKPNKRILNTLETGQIDRHHASLTHQSDAGPDLLQQQTKTQKRPKYINVQKKAIRDSAKKNSSNDDKQIAKQMQQPITRVQRPGHWRATTNCHLGKPPNQQSIIHNNLMLNLNLRSENEDEHLNQNILKFPSTSRSRQALPTQPLETFNQPEFQQVQNQDQQQPNQLDFYNRITEQEDEVQRDQPTQCMNYDQKDVVSQNFTEEPQLTQECQASVEQDSQVKRDRFNTSQFEGIEGSLKEEDAEPKMTTEFNDNRKIPENYVLINKMLSNDSNYERQNTNNNNNINFKNSSISQISRNVYEKSEHDRNYKTLARFSEKPSQGIQDVQFDRSSYNDHPKLTNTVESMVMNAAAAPGYENQESVTKSPCSQLQKHQMNILVNEKSVSQKDRKRVDRNDPKEIIMQEGKKLKLTLTEMSNCDSIQTSNKNLQMERRQIIQTQQCHDLDQARKQSFKQIMFNFPSQTDLAPSIHDQTQKESEIDQIQMKSSEVLERQNEFQKKFSEFIVSHLGGGEIVTSFNNSENILNTNKEHMFDFMKNTIDQNLKKINTGSNNTYVNNTQSKVSQAQLKENSNKSKTGQSSRVPTSSVPSQRVTQPPPQIADLLQIQQQFQKSQNEEIWQYIFAFEKRVENNISEINRKQDQILQILLNQQSKSFFTQTAPDSNHRAYPDPNFQSYNSPFLSNSQTHQAIMIDSNTLSNIVTPETQLTPNNKMINKSNLVNDQKQNNIASAKQNDKQEKIMDNANQGVSGQNKLMNLIEQESENAQGMKGSMQGGQGGRITVEFEDDDESQAYDQKLEQQNQESDRLAKFTDTQSFNPNANFRNSSVKQIPPVPSQKSINNSQSEKNVIKMRHSQDIPKPPTATFRYTPGHSGTEASKECLNDEAHLIQNQMELNLLQRRLSTQGQVKRVNTLENQLTVAKQQLAQRLSTLRTQSAGHDSQHNIYQNPNAFDITQTKLSPDFVNEIENLNLDQNLDLPFFKNNGRNIVLGPQSSSKQPQQMTLIDQIQPKSSSKSPLPTQLSPDDQSLQFSNYVNTMMKNMPSNFNQQISQNTGQGYNNQELFNQNINKFPITDISELRNRSDCMTSPYVYSNDQYLSYPSNYYSQNAHEPQQHLQYNSNPSTVFAGAPTPVCLSQVQQQQNSLSMNSGYNNELNMTKQRFLIIDPATGEEVSVYLEKDMVKKMNVLNHSANLGKPAVNVAEYHKTEPVYHTTNQTPNVSINQQQWMSMDQQSSIQQQLDDLNTQKEQILDRYQQIKNRTLELENQLSKGEKRHGDNEVNFENEQLVCEQPSQGGSFPYLIDQNAHQSILSSDNVNPMINMKEKILKDSAQRQTSKSQYSNNQLPYPMQSQRKKLISDMTNIFGHSFVTSHDQLNNYDNVGDASFIRAAVTHGPPSREASIINPAQGRHSSDLYFKGHKMTEEVEDQSRNINQNKQFSPELLSSFLTILNSYNMECQNQKHQQLKLQQLSQQKTAQSAQPAIRDDYEQIIDVGQAIKHLESHVKTKPFSSTLLNTPINASALRLDPLTIQHATALLTSTLQHSGQSTNGNGSHVVPATSQQPLSHQAITTPPIIDDHDTTSKQDFENLKELAWSTSSHKRRIPGVEQLKQHQQQQLQQNNQQQLSGFQQLIQTANNQISHEQQN